MAPRGFDFLNHQNCSPHHRNCRITNSISQHYQSMPFPQGHHSGLNHFSLETVYKVWVPRPRCGISLMRLLLREVGWPLSDFASCRRQSWNVNPIFCSHLISLTFDCLPLVCNPTALTGILDAMNRMTWAWPSTWKLPCSRPDTPDCVHSPPSWKEVVFPVLRF